MDSVGLGFGLGFGSCCPGFGLKTDWSSKAPFDEVGIRFGCDSFRLRCHSVSEVDDLIRL